MKRPFLRAEAIGQLQLQFVDDELEGHRQGVMPGGTVVAGEVREGREAEAGRDASLIDLSQDARVPSICEEG